MTLDKAIDILTIWHDDTIPILRPGLRDAIKLGIEAITYIIRLRACSFEHRHAHLPSETSIEDTGLSDDRLYRVRESPLGTEPVHKSPAGDHSCNG